MLSLSLSRRRVLALGTGLALTHRLSVPLDATLPGGLAPLTRGLRVMTWNLVHGTRVSVPPGWVPRRFVEARIDHAAAVIERMHVDALMLQEADGDPRIDRTQRLASGTGLLAASTAGAIGHGATLVTRRAPLAVTSAMFRSRGWDPKGVTIARVQSLEGRELDVASVHLHAFSADVRIAQIRELADIVAVHRRAYGERALVVAGDLNDDARGTTRLLAGALGLHTSDEETPTFTELGLAWRLDWVLVSPDLELTAHRVLGPGTSDHHPIVADIAFRRAS